MTHRPHGRVPTDDDLVLLRFALPAKLGKATPTDVYMVTCSGGAIRLPKSLLKEQNDDHFLFEARVPRNVAAAFRNVYGEVGRLTRMVTDREH